MMYSQFAAFYDRLQEADYSEIGAYYHKFLHKNGILLDLACGTGKLSRYFADLGYDVIGADVSPEMLSEAMKEPRRNIQYLLQDMTQLDLYGTIDCCICTLDGINHLPDAAAVKRTFERVALFMNSGGVFAFDLNTLYKHNKTLSGNSFIFDFENLYCVWNNSRCTDGKIDMTLDIFAKQGNSWQRYTESLSERAYPISEIVQMLTNTGFGDIKIYDWLTEDPADELSEKAVFVAVKL